MALGQIVGGIAQLSAARQMKRAAQELTGMSGEKQVIQEAQARKGAQMPGMGFLQAQQAQQQAGLLGQASRQGTSGSNFMALAAALGAQGNLQAQNLAAQQAQFNEAELQRRLQIGQQYGMMGRQLGQAALQTKTAGLAALGSGIESAALFAAGGGFNPASFTKVDPTTGKTVVNPMLAASLGI